MTKHTLDLATSNLARGCWAISPRPTDREPRARGHGPQISHLGLAYKCCCGSVGVRWFCLGPAQRQGLLCSIHAVDLQAHGPWITGRAPWKLGLYLCSIRGAKMDSDDGLANSNTPENDSNSGCLSKRLFSQRTSGSAQLPPSVAER